MAENIVPVGTTDSFRFECSKRIACFNSCCRDLNQFLTPYDIVRLKNNLGVSSGRFLERYTLQHTGPQTGLPVVTLKPSGTADEARCPFVSEDGCRVYDDRPGSCRMYPLARLASRSRETGEITEHYAILRESHCRGFEAGESHTVGEWIEDQGLGVYNEMNDRFMEIISLKNRLMPGPMDLKSRHMFHLACYDLDNFRRQIREEGLLCDANEGGSTDPAIYQNDDIELMKVGLKWVREAVFGRISAHDE